MEEAMERQVWQRVLSGREETACSELNALYCRAWEEAAALCSLMRRLGGCRRELAQQLWEGAREKARTLGGLMLLEGGLAEEKKLPGPMPRESAVEVVRRCYGWACRDEAEFTARSAQRTVGAVFRTLAQREGERCGQLARLLWELERNPGNCPEASRPRDYSGGGGFI